MNFLKTHSILARIAFAALILLTPFSLQADSTIAITQIVDHPSLNDIRKGIIDELASQGFKEGNNLKVLYENAQGNPALAVQIAQKFASSPVDAIIPISTPSAQPIVQHIRNTPIIFAAISDPLGAQVVASLEHPKGNVTGVADIPPIKEQLDFVDNCLPNLKTIGVVYNPGEANSATFVDSLTKLATPRGIKIVTAAALNSAAVQSAANSLIPQVDAIFIGNDNTVVSGLEPLVKATRNAKIPLFASDPDSVERGALAAFAYDQYKIGRQVGRMVAKVLKGAKVKGMSVELPDDLNPYFNTETSDLLNMTCSPPEAAMETM